MFHYIKSVKHKNGKNPFAVSFVYYAAICCLFLGVVFLFVIYDRENKLRDEYLLEKVDLVLADLETQVESFDLAALDISHDKRFYYSVLGENKYNEFAMVQVFRDDYKNMIGLTKDIFLFYKDSSSVFHVNGSLIDIDTYLRVMPEEERTELIKIMNEKEYDVVDIVPMSDALYMLQPFGAGTHHDAPKAILGAVVSYKELENRIKMVSGGLKGTLTLSMGEKQLYCNGQSEDIKKQVESKDSVLKKTSPKGMFTITYIPETNFLSWESQKNQYLLIVVDMLLVFILAWLFAQKAYKPLRELREKLQSENILSEEKRYENVFE